MNRFAALLDRLGYEPRRNAKLRLLVDYFRHTPDPDRGYALAAMTGALMFKEAKAGLIRGLVEERTDPELFRMSYHYVGDLAETVALIWPAPGHEAAARVFKGADQPSSPLWGGVGGGGVSDSLSGSGANTPSLDPSPQGGGRPHLHLVASGQ